jgi:hypothetical protein
MNQLYYGDNLQVLREHIADESASHIYLEPTWSICKFSCQNAADGKRCDN